MKHCYLLAAVAALFVMTATSCEKEDPLPLGDNTYTPMELSTKAAGFVQKGSTFSFDYIDRVNKEAKGDYVVSPLSMQFLLGMLLDGAAGETAAQIAKVLGYGAGEVDDVNDFCLSMLEQLPKLDNLTKLNIANAIFLDDGWPLNKNYVKTVGKYFKAEVSNLDFSNNDASLKAINGWASKQTNGLVDKVLDQVDPSILAYLMNALYFKSEWVSKFPKGDTSNETFTDESGTKKTVKMMKQTADAGSFQTDVFQAIRLPYGNGAFAMTIFLPKDGYKVADVTAALKKDGWNESLMGSAQFNIWLPKFETKFKIKLNDILSAMGMPLAFTTADFSPMSPAARRLSFVQQDAIIKVDEEGSEAAAVSVAAMEKNGASGPRIFHADHPFLYLITEKSTGVVLFAGRYSGN
jgi:serpin B